VKGSLREYRKAWKEGRKRKPEERKQLDAGTYELQCCAAEVAESKSSGQLQIRWRYRVKRGKFRGESVFDYTGLGDERVDFAMRRIGELGYEIPDTLDELEEVLEEIAKDKPVRMCAISYQQGSDFPRLRFQVEDSPEDEDEDEPEDEPEEEDEDTEDEEEPEEGADDEVPWEPEEEEEETKGRKAKTRAKPKKKGAKRKRKK
jgi:hypothetical protein